MKKGKFKLTITSDDKHVLECLQSFLINDGEQACLVPDKETGEELYYPTIDWEEKSLDLFITCDYETEYK